MKVFIITYNRLTLPVNLANFVAERGCEPVFIDNNSTYPPLLDYYHDCPYIVMHMNRNYGQNVVWNPETTIFERLGITENYIVTDPDLDLSGVPDDFLQVLEEGLRRYPQYDKCGLSLEINDIPNQVTKDWESRFWQHPLDERYFHADIDTTFALYRITSQPKFPCLCALRTNRPYVCRHVPWYYDLVDKLPEDESYYYHTQSPEIRAHSNILDRKPGRW